MNKITFKLFIWKHPALILTFFAITIILFVPLVVIYFLITLLYLLTIETNVMKMIVKRVTKK